VTFKGINRTLLWKHIKQMKISLFKNVVERVSSTPPSVSTSKNLCSPLYSVRAAVAQSVQCSGHWLAVRGIFIQFPAANESFCSTRCPSGLRDPLSSLFNGHRTLFPRGSSGWHVKLTTHLHLRKEQKPTWCYWMLYCTYNLLNMFRPLICPSSGARDYTCVIAAYGV